MKFFSYYGMKIPIGKSTYSCDIPISVRRRARNAHHAIFKSKITYDNWKWTIIDFEDFEIITDRVICRGTIFGDKLLIENMHAHQVSRGHGTEFIKQLHACGFRIWTWSELDIAKPFWNKMRKMGWVNSGEFWR